MRKQPLFICIIIAMVLSSCVHRARDRRIAEVITDSMRRGESINEYGWVQGVKLLCVKKITVEERLKHNIDYYRSIQRSESNQIRDLAADMAAMQQEILVWKDSLASYKRQGRNTDTINWRLQNLAVKMEVLKWDIANTRELAVKSTRLADSIQALKVDGDQFGGYYIWLAYTRIKEGMKILDTTAKLVTEDWRCQNMVVKGR